jgi:hypothetical protein
VREAHEPNRLGVQGRAQALLAAGGENFEILEASFDKNGIKI